jgi:hypothetical protein
MTGSPTTATTGAHGNSRIRGHGILIFTRERRYKI